MWRAQILVARQDATRPRIQRQREELVIGLVPAVCDDGNRLEKLGILSQPCRQIQTPGRTKIAANFFADDLVLKLKPGGLVLCQHKMLKRQNERLRRCGVWL